MFLHFWWIWLGFFWGQLGFIHLIWWKHIFIEITTVHSQPRKYKIRVYNFFFTTNCATKSFVTCSHNNRVTFIVMVSWSRERTNLCGDLVMRNDTYGLFPTTRNNRGMALVFTVGFSRSTNRINLLQTCMGSNIEIIAKVNKYDLYLNVEGFSALHSNVKI